jgi:CDP-6-deoxy-D-xylo-4-hexulose-3-dehydrase
MLKRNFRISGDTVESDRVMRQTFWIGIYPGLGSAQIDYMAEIMHAFCRAPVAIAGASR